MGRIYIRKNKDKGVKYEVIDSGRVISRHNLKSKANEVANARRRVKKKRKMKKK